MLIGKRLGYGKTAMPPHNLTYTAIGAAMLWVGWFGFNAGSAVNAGALASGAFMVTHFRRRCGPDVGRPGMGLSRQAQRAGDLLGRGGGVGLHHARLGLCNRHAGLAHGRGGILCLLHRLHAGQDHVRLR